MSLLIRGIGELLTLEGAWRKSGKQIKEVDLGSVKKAALLIEEGRVKWVGPEKKMDQGLSEYSSKQKKSIKEINIKGQTVLPGWIDCHTHLVYGGHRWEEFEQRCQGVSYQEIAARGGGILSTMNATRFAKKNDLIKSSQKKVDHFVRQGVTTIEIKSGYALNLKDELKQLEVAKSLKGPRIITTFLGAHALPPEYQSRLSANAKHVKQEISSEFSSTSNSRSLIQSSPSLNSIEYLNFLIEKVLPIIKKKKLSRRVDIFIEKNFFEYEIAKNYLLKAKELGFEIVIHADQLSLSGGTQLAVELEAQSADHVIQIGPREIQSLARSQTVAVLLPLADLYMKCDYPPARALIDAGASVALATDFNPGSCPSMDIMLVGLLARLYMKMTLPEVISAWTVGGARALGLNDIGSLQKGFMADFQIIDQDWRGLFYQAGHSEVKHVFSRGRSLTPWDV